VQSASAKPYRISVSKTGNFSYSVVEPIFNAFDPQVLERRIVEALLEHARQRRTKGRYAEAERISKKALDRAEAVTA